MLRDQGLDQPSSEKLLPAVDGDRYRESQLDNMQTMGSLGTFSPKCDVSIKLLLPSGLEKSRGKELFLRVREALDTKETRPPKHSRTDTLINSQRPWQLPQGLHRCGPDEVPVLRGNMKTSPLPNSEAISKR